MLTAPIYYCLFIILKFFNSFFVFSYSIAKQLSLQISNFLSSIDSKLIPNDAGVPKAVICPLVTLSLTCFSICFNKSLILI